MKWIEGGELESIFKESKEILAIFTTIAKSSGDKGSF